MTNTPRLLRCLSASLVVCLAACASDEGLDEALFQEPETSVSYEAEITGLPNDEMTEQAMTALATFQRQSDGAQSLPFLKRRAESDRAVLTRLLRSRGFYTGEIEIDVVETAPTEADEDQEKEKGGSEARVTFTVTPGEPFILDSHSMP
ncbi:MAG: hypothetical protein AAGI13_12940, partial [Pseudomonadota bacterium]